MPRVRLRACGLLTLVISALFFQFGSGRGVYAAAGDLDPTFGSGGVVTTRFDAPVYTPAQAVVRQPDGKVVAAGSFAFGADFVLARYNTAGGLDPTFGTGGTVRTDFHDGSEGANALVLQADGKLVAAGWTHPDPNQSAEVFALARYLPNGSLDPAFGSGGLVTTSVNGADQINALLLQPDGRIVAAGATGPGFALARYLPSGVLDPAFGAGGLVTTAFPNRQAFANGLALQADGKLVAAGGDSINFALARYNPNGSLDGGFGSGGLVTTAFYNADTAHAVAVAPGGKIVVAGEASRKFALARYLANGDLDPTFDGDGKVTTSIGTQGFDIARALVVQADGKAVAAGSSVSSGPVNADDFALARYNLDGSLDASFGTGGIVTTDVLGANDVANALLLQPDGTLVAAGYAQPPPLGILGFALVRYQPNGSLDSGFGSDGRVTTAFASSAATGAAVARQPDGRILVAGTARHDQNMVLLGYTPAGQLDASFGTGGIVTTHFTGNDNQAYSLALQADGKILMAGTVAEQGGYVFALARYLADGSPDSSFGSAGQVTTAFSGDAFAYALAVQADGKIIAAGTAGYGNAADFALARYNANGDPDATFGTGGQVVTDFAGLEDSANALVLQADGKIVAAGSSVAGTTRTFALARYLPAGTLDPQFGTGGKVTTAFATAAQAAGLVLQPDGHLVAAGSTTTDFALARYLPNGAPDLTFGSAGQVTTDFGGHVDQTRAAVLQPDGRLVAAGFSGPAFALARYNADGSLDAAFGNGGRITSSLGGSHDQVAGLALQPDGKILAAGATQYGFDQAIAVARYLGTGGPAATPTPAASTATRTAAVPTATRTAAVPTATRTATVPTATPARPSPTAGAGCLFVDVCPSDYFFPAVQYLVAHRAISGYSDNTFRPFANTTRGQLAKIVVAAEGWSIDTTGGPHFTDVPAANPFYPFIETAYNHGIISGYADQTFRWGSNVTRGQLSKIIVGAQGWPINPAGGPHFTDVPPTHPFYGVIETAYNHGILSGYANGTFRPGNPATRGQISKIVYLAVITPRD